MFAGNHVCLRVITNHPSRVSGMEEENELYPFMADRESRQNLLEGISFVCPAR